MRKRGEVSTNVTRYQLQPITGRKHQLRVHLAALGSPIVNDRLYPDLSNAADGTRKMITRTRSSCWQGQFRFAIHILGKNIAL